MPTQTLVVIPTYNERENLRPLVRQVLALDPTLHVLVIDDNSPDETGRIADDLALETGRVHVLHREAKQGLGTAYAAGFAYGLAHGYGRIVEMDADFSHRPEHLPELLAATASADVVIGSRNVPGGRAINWSPIRHAVSKGGSLFARAMLGLPVYDCTSGYKVFRREALERLDLTAIASNGYAFQVEINYACAQAGLRMAEIPILFPDRTQGSSKMSMRIVLEAAWLVVRLRLGLAQPPLRVRAEAEPPETVGIVREPEQSAA